MRTFVAVADAGQFSEAADGLSITQQAVSKRVAALDATQFAAGDTPTAG